jgi:integrase
VENPLKSVSGEWEILMDFTLSSNAKLYLYARVDKSWKYLRADYNATGLTPGSAYLPKQTRPVNISGGTYYAWDVQRWVKLSADPAEAWQMFATGRTEAQVVAIKKIITPQPEKLPQGLTIQEAVEKFLDEYERRKNKGECKAGTIRKVVGVTKIFSAWFGAETLLHSITRDEVMRRIDTHMVKGQPAKAVSKQNLYVYISRLLDHHGISILKKGDRPKPREDERPSIREYGEKEIAAITAVSDEYHSLVWETFKWTGLREKELVMLYRTDVMYDEECDIYFLDVHGKPELGWSTKTYHNREVVVPNDLGKRLMNYERVPGTKFLFPSLRGNKNIDLLRQLKEHAIKAGLDPAKFKLHTFRSTCVSRMLRKGVPITEAKKHIGHSERSNTIWRYAASADKVTRHRMLADLY